MPSSDRVRPDHDTTDVVGARVGAQIVDLVVMFVQVVFVGFVLVALARRDRAGTVRGFGYVGVLTLPLYGGLLEGFWNGQTVGKRLFHVKVVDEGGTEPSLGQAFFRNLPAIVLFSWVTTAVALLSIATSDRRQRLFDRAADTYVVRTRRYSDPP